jgi:hypothetical protein
MHTCYTTLIAVWLGSFITLGGFIVPTLFTNLSVTIAADIAVLLFKLHGLIGFVVITILFLSLYLGKLRVFVAETTLLTIVMVGAILLQFWVIPGLLIQRTELVKQTFWHTAATGLFLLQTVCVLLVFVQRLRKPTLSISDETIKP